MTARTDLACGVSVMVEGYPETLRTLGVLASELSHLPVSITYDHLVIGGVSSRVFKDLGWLMAPAFRLAPQSRFAFLGWAPVSVGATEKYGCVPGGNCAVGHPAGFVPPIPGAVCAGFCGRHPGDGKSAHFRR